MAPTGLEVTMVARDVVGVSEIRMFLCVFLQFIPFLIQTTNVADQFAAMNIAFGRFFICWICFSGAMPDLLHSYLDSYRNNCRRSDIRPHSQRLGSCHLVLLRHGSSDYSPSLLLRRQQVNLPAMLPPWKGNGRENGGGSWRGWCRAADKGRKCEGRY